MGSWAQRWQMGPLQGNKQAVNAFFPLPPRLLKSIVRSFLNSQIVVQEEEEERDRERECVCMFLCVRDAKETGRETKAREPISPPASEHPARAHRTKVAWSFDRYPMLCLVQGIFKFSFIFIEQLPSPPPISESGLRIIGSFSSLICFSDLCSRYRNIWMQQEKKEEREGGGSLSSLPLEGRVYGEGLGSGHILQGKKKQVGWQRLGAQ